MYIARNQYLEKLKTARENGLIKIVTGLRRCGKSYLLFKIFRQFLIEDGVKEDHIIGIALDDMDNEHLRDGKTLLSHIRGLLEDKEMHYVLLDEVQLVEGFTDVLNSLLHNDILDAHKNLMVMKSISKSYGVPGLRLGIFATSDTEMIARMKKEVSIWNINSFGEFYMQIFGKYEKDYEKACVKFIAERNRFYAQLQEIPYLRVIPSQANYFLCEVTSKYTSAQLTQKLIEQDVIISNCGRKHNMEGRNLIRLAVRNRDDNEMLINILREL